MQNSKYSTPKKILLIGASTGGPGIIEKIIHSLFKLNDTAVIIAQHMAVDFIPSFVKRLQEHSINSINIANDSTKIKSGNIYFCHGNTIVKKNDFEFTFIVKPSLEHKYNPDINSIFGSFVKYSANIEIFAVILSGIGDDGVKGCEELSLKGVRVATQNERSAIVDGMPSRARQVVKNIEIYDTPQINEKIKEFCT